LILPEQPIKITVIKTTTVKVCINFFMFNVFEIFNALIPCLE